MLVNCYNAVFMCNKIIASVRISGKNFLYAPMLILLDVISAEFQRCPISIPNGVLEPHCGPATDWLCKFECNSGYHKHIYMSGKLKGVHDDPYMLYCEHGVWKTGYEALGVDVSGVCYAEGMFSLF